MHPFTTIKGALGLLSLLLVALGAVGQNGYQWIDIWTNMPQLVEPENLPPAPFLTSSSVFADTTLRQTIRVSVGAERFRIVFSNTFGGSDLAITSANFASPVDGKPGSSGIQLGTIMPIRFGGENAVVIPKGKTMTSDELRFPMRAQQVFTISMYLQQGQSGTNIDGHPGSFTTSWLQQGNHATEGTLSGIGLAHWYFLSAIQAWNAPNVNSFVILGDSITDGRGSEDNKNNRWPDLLLARLQLNQIFNIAICNQAARGNRVLQDGRGPSLISRYQRDALNQPGVKWVMIFEGVNDIGTAATDVASQKAVGDQLIIAFTQIAKDVKAIGLPIFAATITPFSAPAGASQQVYSDPNREATRQRINNWIRTSGTFSAVVDFDSFIGDPSIPSQLNPLYDSGDFLHPNVAGYQHIADLFPLQIFNSPSTPIPTATTITGPIPTRAHWGQCGGQGYSGPTVCESPYICIPISTYFWNCL